MTHMFLGLLLGVGLVLVASALTGTPLPRPRTPRWYERWSDQIMRSGVSGLTPWRIVGISALMGGAVFLVTYSWTQTATISAMSAAVVLPLFNAFIGARARRRAQDIRVLWPEVIDAMVSGVRAGAALPELLMSLEDTAPEQLRPYFQGFARTYRASGRFETALNALKRRMADPVADRIVEALRLAREVGGADLSLILRDLAVMLREDARIRGELQARQSWTVNAARLGVAAPWLVLVMISGQAQASAAYSTPQGVLVLLLGGAMTVLAYILMQRIGRLSTEDRALR